ncbi:amidase family protein [Conexibacter woesei]|uniref:Amidase n=1 Tax=Conexibacter woesei (strain DSM 14684 / CCUG 47730 / CIP 108061 / JCM 11494 / NBRC 100937 / ID131577) TaxID=469383 RepID=D3F895_CONWI|nr:amidase family protein [Conexibacter woesei]ADB48965.1 Amidase [Conexibacter woesei DSM 14684]
MTAPVDVARLAARLGLGLAEDDAAQLVDLLGELLSPLRYDATPTPPVRRTTAAAPAGDPYNAVVRWCEAAPSADGALSGVRLSVKDSVSVAGVPLTCGSALLQGYVPERDSAVTERILRAGGTIVAITNMDDLAASADGSTSVYGPTLNPFDPARLAGGSSGGAAASLFLGGVDAAIGTDQGGSARVPASWCGVVGLKPTRGLIPYDGIVGTDRLLDHVGILGRDLSTVSRVLAATAGPRPAAVSTPVGDVRLGLLRESLSPGLGVEPAVVAAIEQLVARLQQAGARVEHVSVPVHLQTAEVEAALSVEGMRALLSGGGNAPGWQSRSWPTLASALEAGIGARAARLSPHVKTAALMGAVLEERFRGEHYAHARRRCAGIAEDYDRALRDVDALLLPATPTTAQPHSAGGSLEDVVLRGWAPMANTAQFNVSGHPAISLPLCEVAGLPLGAMLVGRRDEDERLLAIASSIEQTLGWSPAPPDHGRMEGRNA